MIVALALALQAASGQVSDTRDSVTTELQHAGRTPPLMTAVRATRGPTLDGRLDEAIWREAPAITDFTQVRPNDGTEPTARTDVRIAYDDAALYVAARLYDDPDLVIGRLGRRDNNTSSDRFAVMIDSYHDHRTAFHFVTNPAGVRTDMFSTNDQGGGDNSWDPVWEVATGIDSLGWVVEMRIPFSQLRFPNTTEQIWGINFGRWIFRNNEFVRWSWEPNTETGLASLFGHLVGIREIPQPRRLEVLPYTVASTEFTEGADPENPFNDGSLQDLSAGLDLKYGLTSDLTLNATFNPDFGQVEADPAVVNLTAFETFFRERRPFFVEGANLFEFGAGSGGFVFGAPRLFYSRRIGRRPSRFAESDGYADNPTATRIIGAGKLSGKTAGWSVGLLEAVTARTYAQLQRADGTRTAEAVEPLTNYSLLSVRKDFRGGATGVGALATGVIRERNDPLFNFLRSSAYSGGVDFFHRFGQNQFALNGTFSASQISGTPETITSAQRSSARYFQRPDQDYVSLDSRATRLTGWATSFQAGKVAGNWTYGTDFFAYAPEFEVNDAGFQTQVDRIFHSVRLGRRWLDPGKVFRNFRVDVTGAQTWNFGGVNLNRSLSLGLGGQLLNYWNFQLGGSYRPTTQNDKSTRGGPLMQTPRQWSTNWFVGSDSRKRLSLGTFGFYARNRFGGWGTSVGGNVTIRPTGAVNVNLSPRYSRTQSTGFYVTQVPDGLATATFGRRYVFSELGQSTFDLTVRVDVALTPDLSIQLYAQPFVAAGDYDGFKELAAPRTFDFVRYGEDGGSSLSFDPSTNVYTADPDGAGPAAPFAFANPDFRFRSLRGNLVLRWEYLRGSTLFLVWNHGRSGRSSDPTFNALDELRNLWGDDQRNTFLVKFNYWLSL